MSNDSAVAEGFTLVEVLVALVMSAMLMVIIIDGSVTARDRMKKAQRKAEAVSVADAVITRAATMTFAAAPQSGVSNDLVWRLTETVETYDRRGALALVRLEVAVEDRDKHRLFAARTRRLMVLP